MGFLALLPNLKKGKVRWNHFPRRSFQGVSLLFEGYYLLFTGKDHGGCGRRGSSRGAQQARLRWGGLKERQVRRLGPQRPVRTPSRASSGETWLSAFRSFSLHRFHLAHPSQLWSWGRGRARAWGAQSHQPQGTSGRRPGQVLGAAEASGGGWGGHTAPAPSRSTFCVLVGTV